MLTKLKRRLPDVTAPDDDLLEDLLTDSGYFIMNYTGRDSVPPQLESVQVQLAAVLFNRMGVEGETAHDEGGVNREIDILPEDIAAQLKPFRLARSVPK